MTAILSIGFPELFLRFKKPPVLILKGGGSPDGGEITKKFCNRTYVKFIHCSTVMGNLTRRDGSSGVRPFADAGTGNLTKAT
jgi:hypothetical protein